MLHAVHRDRFAGDFAVRHAALGQGVVDQAGQAGAEAELAQRIKNGSQGVWGPIPMPPNAVSDDEAQTLAKWVLSQK